MEQGVDESPEACEIPLNEDRGTSASTRAISFGISGMHCAPCAANIEKTLLRLEGVESATVNIASESASVRFDPSVLDREQIFESIRDAGYTPIVETGVALDEEMEARTREIRTLKRRFIFSAFLGTPLVVLTMGPMVACPCRTSPRNWNRSSSSSWPPLSSSPIISSIRGES